MRKMSVVAQYLYGLLLSLRWRHNDHGGVSKHQTHHCLLNCLFGRRSKKTSKLRVTGLCAGNSPGTSEFPAQMASSARNVSIWWRHHVDRWNESVHNDSYSQELAHLNCIIMVIVLCATNILRTSRWRTNSTFQHSVFVVWLALCHWFTFDKACGSYNYFWNQKLGFVSLDTSGTQTGRYVSGSIHYGLSVVFAW